MIHTNVKVFPIHAPPIKKMCKDFEIHLCYCYIYIISSIANICSSLNFLISVENSSYGMHSSTC
jgi:hypothetical protein